MTKVELRMLEKALASWLRELRRMLKKHKELPQYDDDDEEEED